MARRPEASDSSARSQGRREGVRPSLLDRIVWGRVILWGALGMTVLAGTLFAWRRTEEFFIRDNRFQLSEPADFAGTAGGESRLEAGGRCQACCATSPR